VPFIIFFIAATAELNRPPFDLVEAEQELVGGFNTEYSSIRFSLFYLAEFMNTVTMSALMVTLFFGGPQPVAFGNTVLDIPLLPNGIEGSVWLLLKTLVFLYTYVWLRATLPRFRYDQLMDFGWKILIPASLGWFMLLAAQRLGKNEGWNTIVVTGASVLVLIICYLLLQRAFSVSNKQREAEGSMF
ncbi:MAG: NADH-quinone oxidoreductase subunit NuoH, partial [Actinomycetota bacterium]